MVIEEYKQKLLGIISLKENYKLLCQGKSVFDKEYLRDEEASEQN